MQIIGGRHRFETFTSYALRNGPVAAGSIAPEFSNFKDSKQSSPSETAEVRRWRNPN